MKNIIVFTKNMLTRQNSASVEYKVYIQNFIETPSDTLPLVYGAFELDDKIMNTLIITAFKTRYRNMRDSVIVSAWL